MFGFFLYIVSIFFGILFGLTFYHYRTPRQQDFLESMFGKMESIVYGSISLLKKIAGSRCTRFIRRKSREFINFLAQHRADAWKLFLAAAGWMIKNGSREECQEAVQDPSLQLTEWDIGALEGRLNGHPYDSPLFYGCAILEGVAWYDFRAPGLAQRYGGIDMRTLVLLSENTIRKYMRETRRRDIVLLTKAASPTQFYFGIALSPYGEKQLARECQKIAAAADVRKPAPSALEEEIDLSPGPEDGG